MFVNNQRPNVLDLYPNFLCDFHLWRAHRIAKGYNRTEHIFLRGGWICWITINVVYTLAQLNYKPNQCRGCPSCLLTLKISSLHVRPLRKTPSTSPQPSWLMGLMGLLNLVQWLTRDFGDDGRLNTFTIHISAGLCIWNCLKLAASKQLRLGRKVRSSF